MKCPACQAPCRPGAAHCKQCQAELPPTCMACGAPVDVGVELCMDCRTARVPAAISAELDGDLDDLTASAQAEGDDADPATPDAGFLRRPALVGRQEVLGRLGTIIEAAANERRLRFVVLVGESGMGKTRVAEELARSLAERRGTGRSVPRVLVGTCGGPGAPPFAVFERILAARFGLVDGEKPARARDKIAEGVSKVLPASRAMEVTHFLAHLAGYPFPDSPVVGPLAETPTQLEARVFIAVRRFLAADADRSPLVLLLDEVERASPETVNLAHYLAAGLEDHPVVLLTVGRPELFDAHPSFGEGDALLERLELGPLAKTEAASLCAELCAPAGPPPERLLRHVRDSMAGVPRALVELVRFLLESGCIRRVAATAGGQAAASGWTFDAGKLATTELPKTMEDLLAARLRSMDAAERDLLERASACGEAFWLDCLVALVRSTALEEGAPDGPSLGEIAAAGDRTRVEVQASLGALVERGLVVHSRHSTIVGEREYRFAYPPWWDVVYDSIDAGARRRYHRIIAQWLELRPEGTGEERQEEVGRHLERAGDGTGASVRYRRAADAARDRYFNDKAIRLYTQALESLGPSSLAMRIGLWHDLGSVYQMKGDHDSARAAFERMLRLTWVVASRNKSAVALNKLGRVYRQKGELNLALEYLGKAEELFRSMRDDRGVAGSLDDIGQVEWLLGRYDEALDHSAAALEIRRRLGDKRSVAVSLLNIGNIERHRGLFDEAAACYREALEIRRALGDKAGISQALNGLGNLSFRRGDIDGARASWEESLGIAEEVGALPLQATLEYHLGEIAFATSGHGEARTRFERAEQLAKEIDDKRLLSDAIRQLGLIAMAAGDNTRAQELCGRALDIAEQGTIPVNVGRALISLGEVHASTLFDDAGADGESAVAYFERGIDVFRRIGNEAELAVALERFGLYRVERGEGEEGRKLLTEASLIASRLGMRAGDSLKQMITELD